MGTPRKQSLPLVDVVCAKFVCLANGNVVVQWLRPVAQP